MARITVEDCLEKVSNRFTLILLAAERSKQLLSGTSALVENDQGNKWTAPGNSKMPTLGVHWPPTGHPKWTKI